MKKLLFIILCFTSLSCFSQLNRRPTGGSADSNIFSTHSYTQTQIAGSTPVFGETKTYYVAGYGSNSASGADWMNALETIEYAFSKVNYFGTYTFIITNDFYTFSDTITSSVDCKYSNITIMCDPEGTAIDYSVTGLNLKNCLNFTASYGKYTDLSFSGLVPNSVSITYCNIYVNDTTSSDALYIAENNNIRFNNDTLFAPVRFANTKYIEFIDCDFRQQGTYDLCLSFFNIPYVYFGNCSVISYSGNNEAFLSLLTNSSMVSTVDIENSVDITGYTTRIAKDTLSRYVYAP